MQASRGLKQLSLDCAFILNQPGIKTQKEILDEPRKVRDFHFCLSNPTARQQPTLAGLSRSVVQDILGLSYEQISKDSDSAAYLAGSKLLEGSRFGQWAGQLGDGRAHLLGAIQSKTSGHTELQLKGSGRTPFSRFADGNSVVSSALREFLVSEALHGLGVPTTRALSLVISQNDPVKRDPFYNGIIKIENAATVVRVSPSFIRFGSMQICLPDQGNNCYREGDYAWNRQMVKGLADLLLKHNYKHIDAEEKDPYEQMFTEILDKTAKLVAKWQSIGFVHGVLNTDNMSMVNVTIDYGPFAFIDYFSKDFVSNATDNYERYSYRRQPEIVRWNLMRLAEALDFLVPAQLLKKHVQDKFDSIYFGEYHTLMANKLGFKDASPEINKLVEQLFDIMDQYGSNFTNTFRIFTQADLSDPSKLVHIAQSLVHQGIPVEKLARNLKVIPSLLNAVDKVSIIKQHDPGFNPYLILDQPKRLAAKQKLEQISLNTYQAEQLATWMAWLPKYSQLITQTQTHDKTLMQNSNPRYVLRNDIASRALRKLNALTTSSQRLQLTNKLLDVFGKPYTKCEWFEQEFWNQQCQQIRLTCSS